ERLFGGVDDLVGDAQDAGVVEAQFAAQEEAGGLGPDVEGAGVDIGLEAGVGDGPPDVLDAARAVGGEAGAALPAVGFARDEGEGPGGVERAGRDGAGAGAAHL
ncbi:hypothetical protein ADL26_20785, partial [Thermoactinomyces vulgaris]